MIAASDLRVWGVGGERWHDRLRPFTEVGEVMASDAVEVLKGVPLFAGLSRSELRSLAKEAREERFPEGTDIVTEGQEGGPFFCITEGRAGVYVGGKKVKDLLTGSFFGEMALLEGSKRSATIRAESNVRALAITSWNFLATLEENWGITKKILITLSKRIRELEQSLD
jgi:CRP/FNR family transcriptional regulator, cyclic AMP receptor protein